MLSSALPLLSSLSLLREDDDDDDEAEAEDEDDEDEDDEDEDEDEELITRNKKDRQTDRQTKNLNNTKEITTKNDGLLPRCGRKQQRKRASQRKCATRFWCGRNGHSGFWTL